MKKSFLLIAATVATMLFMTSCHKEEVTNQGFTAILENSTPGAKTILSGTHIHWDFGNDLVRIYDANNTYGDFTAQVHSSYSNDATCANLVPTTVTLAEEGGYKAIYPASIAQSNNTITLPRTQNSTNGELSEYPMYAESNTKTLQFKNLCSVLKLTLQKANKSVSKIQIVTDQLTTGTFQINYNSGNPTITPSTTVFDHTAVTTMELASAVDISSAHDFYIYLPANTYNYMQVKVYDANGLMFFKTWRRASEEDASITFIRSQYNTLSFGEDDIEFQEGLLSGKFHVSATKVVSFSKGNLLRSTSNTSNYKLADKQYDYTESGYSFRFIWGTRSTSSTYTEYGNNNITNGGGSNQGWFTLSSTEWNFVTNTNSSNRHDYFNSDFLHARALLKVTKENSTETVGGMVLFPDYFHWPLDDNKKPHNYESAAESDWNNETLSYDDWKVLEDAGCVFLPYTHGYANAGGTEEYSNNSIDGQGYYWSSSVYPSVQEKARYMYFTKRSALFTGNQYQYKDYYMSIRLVKQVSANQ